jgi:hypothetical protein
MRAKEHLAENKGGAKKLLNFARWLFGRKVVLSIA